MLTIVCNRDGRVSEYRDGRYVGSWVPIYFGRYGYARVVGLTIARFPTTGAPAEFARLSVPRRQSGQAVRTWRAAQTRPDFEALRREHHKTPPNSARRLRG